MKGVSVTGAVAVLSLISLCVQHMLVGQAAFSNLVDGECLDVIRPEGK